MPKVSESIFSNGDIVIPMADVQHIEKVNHGIVVITIHTKWNFDHDCWENGIFVSNIDDKDKKFLDAWSFYRHELEGSTEAFIGPEVREAKDA